MLYKVLFSIVLLLNFLLSLIVLLKNPRKHINIAFFLFVVSLLAWMVTNYYSNQFADPASALLFNKLIFLSSPYITFSLLYFSLVFPNETTRISRANLFYAFVPVLISNVLTLSNQVITDITFLENGGTGVVFGPGIVFFATQFILYLIISLVILTFKYIKNKGYERLQMQYLIFGIGTTMVLLVFTNLIIPLVFNNFWFSNVGPFFTLIMVAFISYAIVRHRLLEIKLIIARSVLYTLLIFVIATLYTLGVFVMSSYIFSERIDIKQEISHVLLALFVSFTFVPLRNFIENRTNRLFYKGNYDQHDLVYQLTRIIASTIALEDVTTKTLQKLLSTLRIGHGTFLILKKNRQFDVISKGKNVGDYDKKTLEIFNSIKRMVIFDEEQNKKVKSLMRANNIAIVLPLFERDEKVGILLLGDKKTGQIYSQRDIGVLEIFGPAISVAIQNAKSYEAIKNFNITLKKEVQSATKDLKSANEKLKELGKQKDDFMAIASHELKTPVTSIKLYTQLLHQKFKKLNDTKSAESVEKMDMQLNKLISLINDLLDVTKIEEGKLQFNFKKFNINKLINEITEEMQLTTKHRIEKDLGSGGDVYADQERIGQVLTNFISNAIKYSPDANKIIIKTTNGKKLTVSIQDFGMGLAPSEQKKVFERFNRAGQEGKGGMPGLGLGLYISKEIVKRHNGEIWVESKKGKGSTFSFSLPIK